MGRHNVAKKAQEDGIARVATIRTFGFSSGAED
jgi:hypothetical protein